MEPKHQNRVLRYAMTFLKWNFALKPVECSVNSFCGHKYKPKTVFLGMHCGWSCCITIRGYVHVLLCWSSPLLCPHHVSFGVSPLLLSVHVARLLPSALFFFSPFFPGQSQPVVRFQIWNRQDWLCLWGLRLKTQLHADFGKDKKFVW